LEHGGVIAVEVTRDRRQAMPVDAGRRHRHRAGVCCSPAAVGTEEDLGRGAESLGGRYDCKLDRAVRFERRRRRILAKVEHRRLELGEPRGVAVVDVLADSGRGVGQPGSLGSTAHSVDHRTVVLVEVLGDRR
jgi:hypothetical protein